MLENELLDYVQLKDNGVVENVLHVGGKKGGLFLRGISVTNLPPVVATLTKWTSYFRTVFPKIYKKTFLPLRKSLTSPVTQ